MTRTWLSSCCLWLAMACWLFIAAEAGAENPCLQGDMFLASATEGEDSGIGGTGFSGGESDDDSGIGGTGLSGDDSGIGGTGIYGTITNFGSLCVNGLRVHYGDDVPFDINGRAAPVTRLAVGQVVWVEASARRDDLFAERISVLSAAIGRIEALEPQERRLEVGQEWIEVPAGAIVLDGSGREASDLSDLSPGDVVDVSGLRRADGHIVASRLEQTDEAAAEAFEGLALSDLLRESRRLVRFSIEGYVGPREGPGRLRLGGVELDTSSVPDLRAIEVDTRVWFTGARLGDEKIRVNRVHVPRAGALDRANSLAPQDASAAGGAPDPESSRASAGGPDSAGRSVETSGTGGVEETGEGSPSPVGPISGRPPEPPDRLDSPPRPPDRLDIELMEVRRRLDTSLGPNK